MCKKLVCLILFVLVIVTTSVHADLAHHWTLDEDTNAGATTVADSVGGKDGTINGASSGVGVFGNSLYFDGAGTVEVTEFDTADLKSMTITFWMNPDVGYTSKGGYKRVISANDGWEVIMQPDSGLLGNNLYRTGGEYAQSTVAPPEGEWTHVAMTADLSPPGTGLMEIYLNGEFDASMENQVIDDWEGGTFLMGYRASGGGEHYEGSLDDIRIYNEVLSEIEIKAAMEGVVPTTIHVDPNSDLAAANESAQPGDTIEFAEGTYNITSQILVKDGVTYKGAGPGLTIIDGNDTTRAFVAWGDRSHNEGNENPNDSGPKGWVLEGMTIQNCVADTNDRFSYTFSAFDMNDVFAENDADGSGGLNPEEANADSAGIRLPGPDGEEGTEDDDLHRFEHMDTDGNGELSQEELLAQIAVSEDEFGDESRDGGALFCGNQAVGTIANCDFLNNHTPPDGDDGGAIFITGQSEVTINACQFKVNYTEADDGGAILVTGLAKLTLNDCLFDGNYAVSPDATNVDGKDGDAGHVKTDGSSASAITPGTTLIANRCYFLNGSADDDAGAIQQQGVGSVVRLDACWFEGNKAGDDSTVLEFIHNLKNESTVTNCVFYNNISPRNSSDFLIKTKRNTKFVNCSFIGNDQDDNAIIRNNADNRDTDGDGENDETSDTTLMINCLFANNIIGNGDQMLESRNNDFSISAINCLFFNNTRQNGEDAPKLQGGRTEEGTVEADPLLDALTFIPGIGSPAIDAGVDPATVGVTLTTDYNGNARPQGAAYDIGAIEVPAE